MQHGGIQLVSIERESLSVGKNRLRREWIRDIIIRGESLKKMKNYIKGSEYFALNCNKKKKCVSSKTKKNLINTYSVHVSNNLLRMEINMIRITEIRSIFSFFIEF